MEKILSIDGGGVRGLIAANVLVEVEEQVGPINEYFDLITGTSTGAILAGLLAIGVSAKEAKELYEEKSDDIFDRRFRSRFGLSSLNYKYNNTNLVEILKDFFGDKKLSDFPVKTVINSFDINHMQPALFKSYKSNGDIPAWKAILSSTAAPTYFAPVDHEDKCLIDGGVLYNNPSLIALIESQKIFDDEIKLLSIGTSDQHTFYEKEDVKSWGMLKWIKPLMDIMMKGRVNTSHYLTEKYFERLKKEDNYLRIQQLLKEDISLDDTSNETKNKMNFIASALVKSKKDQLSSFLL